MSDRTLLVILLVPLVLALGFGLWAGLGYPGLYDKYASTGRASRRSPFERLMEWIMRRIDRRR